MVNRKTILITGSKGQLGSSLKKISKAYNYNFIFTDKSSLDITNFEFLKEFFQKNTIDTVINCAAFTDVDRAEFKKNIAKTINHKAVSFLAEICHRHNIQLVHISTDYVFAGNQDKKYNENDIPKPISYYGKTKLDGENSILKYNLNNSIIIRTSWLYSESKNNFVSKILDKFLTHSEVKVVNDEIGSPTNSLDLAKILLDIIPNIRNNQTEIYHFSNIGHCSRFEFANEIKGIMKSKVELIPYTKNETKIIRPKFSVLDISKITKHFNVKNETWQSSLNAYLKKNKTVYNYEI
tara:strand:- start:10269 stop:11150 length:882 start_codon:yes stop_codon:yes gene_type:complete